MSEKAYVPDYRQHSIVVRP